MSTTDVFAVESISGTSLFSVDASGNVTAAGTITTTGTDDFGTNGIKADVIAESTSAAGVTIDSLLIKDGKVDLNGVAGALILDADADTHIGASTDDQIDITISGAIDFTLTANTLTAASGSTIATNTIAETTSGSGVTIDALKIKDGKVVTPQFVLATVAAADATGGSTDSAFTLSLTTADGQDLVAAAQVMVLWTTAQYGAELPNSHVTFATATTGSIVASGNGWALVQTDAAGDFACTCANSSDETLYVAASVPWAGSSTPTSTPWVVNSNSDAATWSP